MAAASSESLRSADKQGLSSGSQQHPVPLDCCCTQDRHILGASAHVSRLGVELTRSMCPRPKARLGAGGKAGTRPGFIASPHPAVTPLTSALPPCQLALPNHPDMRRQNFQQHSNTAQGRGSHQVPKRAVCSCLQSRRWCEVSLTWVMSQVPVISEAFNPVRARWLSGLYTSTHALLITTVF